MGINIKKLMRSFAIVMFFEVSLTAFALDVDSAIKSIIAAPRWVSMSNEQLPKEGPKLMAILSNYTNIEQKTARNLVESLSTFPADQNVKMDIAGKIYIFNRLYLNVPEKSGISNWKVFGGWGGVNVTEGSINSLFPLEKNELGKLELTGRCGGYFGAPYRGLSEFDFLLERYGRRKPE